MVIAILETITEEQKTFLEQKTNSQIILLDRKKINDHIHVIKPDILICRDFDINFNLLESWGNYLKLVYILSVGVNRLPFAELKKYNFKVCKTPGKVSATEISEYVMGAIYFLNYNFSAYLKQQELHIWDNSRRTKPLYKKNILIFGIGDIGTRISDICYKNGMEVVATSRTYHSGQNYSFISLEEAIDTIGNYDFIISSLPLTKETYHFFDYEKFVKIKYGAFINISRGSVVNEVDLVNALNNGYLSGGCFLDVFEKEPLSNDSNLWDLDNVFVTPHISGRVDKLIGLSLSYFVEVFDCLNNNLSIPYLVNLDKEY